MSKNALTPGDDSLILWAESPEEARIFLRRARECGVPWTFDRIFVAKRSPKARTNKYIGGDYYRTTDDDEVGAYDEVVVAPSRIIELVQWCTCDVMISRGEEPLIAVEDTTHIVRMNLYQRFPRLARAARLGVPSVILQGTRGLDLRLRGDRWGLYRYLQAFEAVARVHPERPSLTVWYEPNAASERDAQDEVMEYVSAVIAGNSPRAEAIVRERVAAVRDVMRHGVGGDVARDIQSISHRGDEVIVRVGARPDKKSWREKGSGQMDPYLGMILAAKYIYCYDAKGKKTKDLVLEFTYLPEGFWFFANPDTTALYKRLPLEFADEVRFLGAAAA